MAKARLAPMLSWIAGLAGVGFVAVFLLQAGIFAYLMPAEKTGPVSVDNPGEITAYDSTVSGIDRNNQPYELKAKRGWRDKDRNELTHMETVLATFHKASGEAYNVTSRSGQYDEKRKEFDLTGNVEIVQGDRFTARMEKARVMVEDKSMTSDVPVEVVLGNSTIRANGLKMTDDGANILFLNGVKARFGATPKKGDMSPGCVNSRSFRRR
ncbi:MAG: LPS export ABC transporter periplasmic protein LptC [Methylocella sp.]